MRKTFEYDKEKIEKTRQEMQQMIDKKNEQNLITKRFGASHTDKHEETFKNETIGLLTRDQFKDKREHIDDIIKNELDKQKLIKFTQKKQEKDKIKKNLVNKARSSLSFAVDQEDEENEAELKDQNSQQICQKKIKKNPGVDTFFLPDQERDVKEWELKQKLKEDYLTHKLQMKSMLIRIDFVYQDGANIKRSLNIQLHNKIRDFVEKMKVQLQDKNTELKSLSADDLMFVYKDAIIPNHVTFFDIVQSETKVDGQLLFQFEKQTILLNDQLVNCMVSKENQTYAKVIEKQNYTKNKHVYPCDQWKLLNLNEYIANSQQCSKIA